VTTVQIANSDELFPGLGKDFFQSIALLIQGLDSRALKHLKLTVGKEPGDTNRV